MHLSQPAFSRSIQAIEDELGIRLFDRDMGRVRPTAAGEFVIARGRKLLFEEWVAHGKNSGDDLATSFSNRPNSYQSSLGLYQTGQIYSGKHGRSLRLPTISVRPGKPNLAASSFASGIIREPLNGVEAICPVGREAKIWLLSPAKVIDALIHALRQLPEFF